MSGTAIELRTGDDRDIEVRMIARLKHGGIMRAAEKLGSLKELAAYLGIGYGVLCSWGTFRSCPPGRDSLPQGRWTETKWDDIDNKFRDLIGQGLDELFPEKIRRSKEFWKAPKTFEKTALLSPERLEQLSDQSQQHYYIEDAGRAVDNTSLKTRLAKVLKSLSYREREIIKLRFGLEDGNSYTLDEVAYIFKITRERVRQIEGKAMRKLQQPSRSSDLIDFLEPVEHDGREEQLSALTISAEIARIREREEWRPQEQDTR